LSDSNHQRRTIHIGQLCDRPKRAPLRTAWAWNAPQRRDGRREGERESVLRAGRGALGACRGGGRGARLVFSAFLPVSAVDPPFGPCHKDQRSFRPHVPSRSPSAHSSLSVSSALAQSGPHCGLPGHGMHRRGGKRDEAQRRGRKVRAQSMGGERPGPAEFEVAVRRWSSLRAFPSLRWTLRLVPAPTTSAQ
jgi:hypothetical protein